MPTFVYRGLPKEQKKALLDAHMAPLMDDYGPHPTFGGFPLDPHGNPSKFYENDNDKPKARVAKEKNRDAYRKQRKKEFEKGLEKGDMSLRLEGMDFPNGTPVEVAEKPQNKRVIAKLRVLPYVDEVVLDTKSTAKTSESKTTTRVEKAKV